MPATVELTADELAELLREAEEAHAAYEEDELDGATDPDWAEWYARYIVENAE